MVFKKPPAKSLLKSPQFEQRPKLMIVYNLFNRACRAVFPTENKGPSDQKCGS